jgi:hypothetical protein
MPQNIDNVGLMPEANYKSAGEFQNQQLSREGLYKSRSQAK